jgi:ubiquinol-cytochrome c reductase cytochrome b/c1 subunit
MNDAEDRSPARIVGLFLVLVVLANGLILPGPKSASEETFYLAFFLHTGFTLYDGRFDATRTVTWVTLIASWVGVESLAFFGFILPWGQLTFWLANVVAGFPLVGNALAVAFINSRNWASEFSPILLLSLLSLDIAVMHRETWGRNSFARIGIFLFAVVVTALAFDFASGLLIERVPTGAHRLNDPALSGITPPTIVPPWPTLALYALLRSIPNKLLGVLAVFAAMIVPIIWPWMRVDLLRRGPTHLLWLSLCLIFATVWIGLAYLGSRSPDPFVILQSQILAFCYFAFFLFAPPVLRKLAVGKMRTSDHRS